MTSTPRRDVVCAKMPAWMSSLLEAVRVRLIEHGDLWDGMHYRYRKRDDDVHCLDVYPAPVIDEEADDEEHVDVLLPSFTLDLSQLWAVFDRVDDAQYNGNDTSPGLLRGDNFKIAGLYHGQPVQLAVYSMCPRLEAEILLRKRYPTDDFQDEDEC